MRSTKHEEKNCPSTSNDTGRNILPEQINTVRRNVLPEEIKREEGKYNQSTINKKRKTHTLEEE
jgi:hypothetical protein